MFLELTLYEIIFQMRKHNAFDVNDVQKTFFKCTKAFKRCLIFTGFERKVF